MPAAETTAPVRAIADKALIVDIPPRLTSAAEKTLLPALTQVTASSRPALILNMSTLAFMDAAGLTLLMMLLGPAHRRKQPLLAYGLSEPYRQVFALVRLDEAVRLYAGEAEALAALGLAPLASQASPAGPATPPRADGWAQPTARLTAPAVPPGTVNLNVAGRRVLSPLHGFGRMMRKTYSVRLTGAATTPTEVIAAWKHRFTTFWPAGNSFYGPHPEIRPGDVGILNLTLLGPLKLYTGVLVIYADETSFCFMTPEGHMFGGLIVFSAHTNNGVTVAQVQPLIRASDPFYEATLRIGLGSAIEDRFWLQSLANLAASFGLHDTPQQTSEIVDNGVQWTRLGNIWYNAAVRSTLYMLAAPLRWARR